LLLPEKIKIRKILFLRFKSAGDTLLATPCFRAVKTWNPEAEVAALADEGTAPVLDGNPCVDGLLVLGGKARTAWKIATGRFDLVIDLHGGSTSALFTLISRAPFRAGFRSYRFRRAYNLLAPSSREILGKEKVHTVEHLLSLLVFLGIPVPENPEPEIRVDPASLASVKKRLEKAGLSAGTPFAVIHPGATLESKRWRAENFTAAAVHIAGDLGLKTVFTAGARERGVLEEVRSLGPRGALVVDRLSLKELAALISLARLYVGNDAGPTHIAAALGIPVVAIFGSSNRVHWRPWTRRGKLVGADLDCIPCPGYTCGNPEKFACLEKATVEDVIRAVDDLMQKGRDTR
jgi:heptosyltransferase-2